MKIGDYKDAMEFFKNSRQLESNGKWKEFVDKMEFEDMVQEPRTMAQEPRLGLQGGQLVQNTADGSRPGYQGPPRDFSSQGTPGVRLNPKELKNIQDDLVNFDGLNLSKRGNSYYIRLRLQKGDNIISKSITATSKNIALFKKEQKAFMKTNYPNVLSNADFEQLRMLDENINLTTPEFAEVLNNKKKTTINGLQWNRDTVQKLQGDLELNKLIKLEFEGKYRKINIAKQIVRDNNPAELKRLNEIPDIDLRNKAIRKKASDIKGQTRQLEKTGTLQGITKNREGSLWKNFYESSKRGDRIKLGGSFNGKDLSFRKNWPKKADGSINWFIKDIETNKPAWQMLEFTDTQTPKGEVRFTYDGLQNQVDDAFGKGHFARSTNAYRSGRELYGKNIMFEGKMQPIGRVIARKTIVNNYKANNKGKVPSEEYIQNRIKINTPSQVHHIEGVGNNPYKVQLVSKDANQKLNAAELTHTGEIRKAKGDPTKIKELNSKFKKTINQISNDYGGIKYDVDGRTVGKAATGESIYTSAVKEIGMSEKQQHKFLKEAGFNIDKCLSEGGRVKLKLGKGVNTCITGVINDELKLAKKSGNVAKFSKFGKLARGAGYLVGWVDIPIELAFALPHLLAGNVQDAKAATTAGLFGYGGKKLAQIDQEKNPGAYKYFKHVQDINDWMDAFNQQQNAESKWGEVGEEYLEKYKKEGDPSGVMDHIVDQYDEAVAKQENIAENYKGYVNEEGEEDLRLIDLGKEEGKKYLRETVKKDWESGMDIDISMPDALPGGVPFNVAPFKEDKITSLEQQIKQKGESFYGGFMKPGVGAAAERLGKPDLYDDWYDAFYGKDPRDAYSDLPLDWASQLAALEKKEWAEDPRTVQPSGIEQWIWDKKHGFAGGGLASLMKKKW